MHTSCSDVLVVCILRDHATFATVMCYVVGCLLHADFPDDGDVKEEVADMLTTQLKTCEVRVAECEFQSVRQATLHTSQFRERAALRLICYNILRNPMHHWGVGRHLFGGFNNRSEH